jgi:hypothetical protein
MPVHEPQMRLRRTDETADAATKLQRLRAFPNAGIVVTTVTPAAIG